LVFDGFARGRFATAMGAPPLRHPLAHRIASHQTFWWRWQRDVTEYARSDATDATYTRPSAPTARVVTGSIAASQVVAVTLRGGGVRCGAYLDGLICDGRVP